MEKSGHCDYSTKVASVGKLPNLPISKNVSDLPTDLPKKNSGRKDGPKKIAIGPSVSGLSYKQKFKVISGGSVAQSSKPSKFSKVGSQAQIVQAQSAQAHPPSLPHVVQVVSNPLITLAQSTNLVAQEIAAPIIPSPIPAVSKNGRTSSDTINFMTLDTNFQTPLTITATPNNSSTTDGSVELAKQHVLARILSDNFSVDHHRSLPLSTMTAGASTLNGTEGNLFEKKSALSRALRGKATRWMKPVPQTRIKTRKAKPEGYDFSDRWFSSYRFGGRLGG
ncbi:hypothetical protein LINGRAHAP2_LOCUS28986 [Linum grandiflorum]